VITKPYRMVKTRNSGAFIFTILNSKMKRNKIKIERKLQIDVFTCYRALMIFHRFQLVVL